MGNPYDTSARHPLHPQNSLLQGIGMNHSTWKPASNNSKSLFFICPLPNALQNDSNKEETEIGLKEEAKKLSHLIKTEMPADALANLQKIICAPQRACLEICQLGFGKEIDWHLLQLSISSLLNNQTDDQTSIQRLSEDFYGFDSAFKEFFNHQNQNIDSSLNEQILNFKRNLFEQKESLLLIICPLAVLDHLLKIENIQPPVRTQQGICIAERYTLSGDLKMQEGEVEVMMSSINDEIEAVGILP